MSYRTASQSALLTASEEQQLAVRITRGRFAQSRLSDRKAEPGDELIARLGQQARLRFMEANLGLVVSIATKMRAPSHIDRQDMVQDGMLGLERAIEKFDGGRGYKFSTYATWWIRQSVQRGLENTAGTIRIPAHRTSELNVALSACDGDYSQLPPALAGVAASASVLSLNKTSPDGDGSLADTVSDNSADPEMMFLEAAEQAAVRSLIGELDQTTRFAIVRRFGLDQAEPATYAEIGSELGVGGEAVRRRVLRALGKLRNPAERLVA